MTEESGWPALLAEYKSVVERFDAVSRALTDALAKPGERSGHLAALVAADAQAREEVVLARTRLINLWRDTQVDQHGPLPIAEATQLDTN